MLSALLHDVMCHDIGLTKHDIAKSDSEAFREREEIPPLSWLPWNVRFPSTWEASAFDFDKAPHVRGLIERFWLDPTKKKAFLCWATRLCKTTTMLSLMAWVAINNPAPMALMFPDKGILEAALYEHIYPMFEETPSIRRQLRPVHKRNKKAIILDDCRIRLANAGSKSDVSGYPALYIFIMESEKCPQEKSSEADSVERIASRCSGYSRGQKILMEGTPAEAESSRVAGMLKDPNVQQVRYHVPCPHCGNYQELEFDRVKYDRTAEGDHTPALAERTARYVCKHCTQDIHDHHRAEMMQAGKWLIDGEFVNAMGEIDGEPKVDSDTMVFGPLSKLYSLFVSGWGVVAKEFVEALAKMRNGDFEAMKKWRGETMAEPYVPQALRTPTHELAPHVRGTHIKGECPAETKFITTTADVGRVGDVLLFHWQVMAWWAIHRQAGEKSLWIPQGAVVDWGTTMGDEEFVRELSTKRFPVSGTRGMVGMDQFEVLIDSGKYSDEIYDLCKVIGATPLKGDSRTGANLGVDWYYWSFQKTGQDAKVLRAKRELDLGDLLMVNSFKTQKYRVAMVSKQLRPGAHGFVYLPMDVCDNWELYDGYFDQLSADVQKKNEWVRTGPNEGGDGLRYGRVAAEKFTHGGTRWPYLRLPLECTGEEVTAAAAAVRYPVAETRFAEGGFLSTQ